MSHFHFLAQKASYSQVTGPLLSSLFIAATLVAGVSSSWADTVYLKNGRSMKGEVIATEPEVVLELPSGGTVRFPASAVERIEESPSPAQELATREKNLIPGSAGAVYRLAEWCRKQTLRQDYKRLLWRTLELDPGHDEARVALGFRKLGALWLTEDDYHQALGKVKLDGRWVSKEEYIELQRRSAPQPRQQAEELLRVAAGKGKRAAREQALTEFRALPTELRAWSLLRGTNSLRWRDRQFAVREMGELQDMAHHNVLTRLAITDGKRSVRDEALQVLKNWENPDTVLSFIPYLSSEDQRHRINATRAINVFPDRRAVAPLVQRASKIWAGFGRAHITSVVQRAFVKDYELVSGGTGLVVQEVADPVVDTFQSGVILDIDVQRVEAVAYAAALQRITGQRFGMNFDKWGQWWANETGKPAPDAPREPNASG